MPLKETIRFINEMQRDGVICEYAIGGAVGAAFYLETGSTIDVDVFVIFPETGGTALVSLGPIYAYAGKRGWRAEGEAIVMGDWPVQFLPVPDALDRDALTNARTINIDDVPTRVLTPEHLVALALRTGRAKDQARILQFLDANVVDRTHLLEILSSHNLRTKCDNFIARFALER